MATVKTYQLEMIDECKRSKCYDGFIVEKSTVVENFQSEMIVEDECNVSSDMLWKVFEDALSKKLKDVFLGDPDYEEPKYSIHYDGEFAYLYFNSFDARDHFPKYRVKIVEPTYVSIGEVFGDYIKKLEQYDA